MTEYAETTTTPLYRPVTEAPVPRRPGASARLLSLEPYGDELLTRSGAYWIFSARLLIVAMALAEAIAWGYVGSLMSAGYPLLTAGVAAAFVLVLIWIIDTSFITLDLARGRYESILPSPGYDPRLEKLKLMGGVVARLAIVTASLVITAPFLAQAIFSGDIREEMNRRNAATVSAQRTSVEEPFIDRLDELRLEQNALERQRIDEAAGVGPSGRHGRGPALETIERQLADKHAEIAGVEQSRAAALARFDSLSPRQLEQQYGLGFVSPGVNSSAAVLEEMSDDPTFGRAETAVRAFLAFLFLGLLILKAFQPRSVSIYFSEQLHSLYDRYRKGIFDSYLPAAERATTGGTVDPLRFEDWCLTTYATLREEEERRRVGAMAIRQHELRIEHLQQLETAGRREIEPLDHRLAEEVAASERLEQDLHERRSVLSALSEQLEEIDAAHHSMVRHVQDDAMQGAAFARAMDAISQLEEKRRTTTARIRDLEGANERDRRRLEIREREIARLRQQIETRQSVVREAETRVGDERRALASLMNQGG